MCQHELPIEDACDMPGRHEIRAEEHTEVDSYLEMGAASKWASSSHVGGKENLGKVSFSFFLAFSTFFFRDLFI